MQARRGLLLSTTVLSLAMGLGTVLASCTGAEDGNASAQTGNPCAAANPCNPCAAANPCNPCAVANPCNPCAAANPRNPCAAANPCNPCAAASPCNPCAAAIPCNPCAAANPCNPCAAANPCNPCAANPCNPCAAAEQVAQASPSPDDLRKLYADLQGTLKAGYSKSGNSFASEYQSWLIFNSQPYISQTHGKRYVDNYANDAAKAAYAKFEKIGKMPAGGVLAKDSFVVKDGKAQPGPLFLMEKMEAGFNPASDDWRYTLIMPNGAVFGTTKGAGSDKVEFCVACHKVVDTQDSLYFLPEEYRAAQ